MNEWKRGCEKESWFGAEFGKALELPVRIRAMVISQYTVSLVNSNSAYALLILVVVPVLCRC